MKRVLLTGASGFVGAQLLTQLLERDLQVTAIVRNKNIKPTEQLTLIETSDLFSESFDWWKEKLQGIDLIIHAAWYAEPGKYLTSALNLDCLQGTLTMCKASNAVGVARFVGIGTCFEYDLEGGILSVETPLKPITPYASAKAAAFMSLTNLFDGEFLWCRLFYLYGEGENEKRLVPYLHKQLRAGAVVELTSGKQIRDFLDVKVAAQMICQSALSGQVGPVNICSGQPITVRALAESIADQYGSRDLLKFGAREDNLVDPPQVVGVCNILKEQEI